MLSRLDISQCANSFSPALYFHGSEFLAHSHSLSISEYVLLLTNMTHVDESKATGCSAGAEIASLVETEPRERFIS